MRTAAAALATTLLGMLAVAATIRADEKKVGLDDVPKAVLKAVKARFPEAKLIKAAEETDEGKTYFEVTLDDDDDRVEVKATPKGKIVEVESEIDAHDLPGAVTKALKGDYPGAKIKKAESIEEFEDEGDDDEDESEKSFEVLLTTADGKTLELKLSPRGKLIKSEDQEGEDEDEGKEKTK